MNNYFEEIKAKLSKEIKLENIEIENDIKNELKKIKSFVCDVHEKKITGWTNKSFDTFVNIGAGGSDLGSKMAVKGLAEYRLGNTRSFFISNVDPDEIESIKKKINPETTLFIISSKSSSTLETITNANTLKSWMVESGCKNINKHFFVVSSNMKLIKDFGLSEDNLFKIWDWVGGRFSLWSAAGLPAALAIGFENFEKMLTGAFAMDQHFLNESPQNNIPVILALIDFWYIHATIIGIAVSMSSNFILNKIWTFEDRNFEAKKTLVQYGKFVGFSSLGALIQLGMVFVLVDSYQFTYALALVFAVAIAASSNFILNKKWTFKEKIWN